MKSSNPQRRLVLLYHYFHPDDVVSARLFSELAEEAALDGWSVLAMPSVRSCHDEYACYPRREFHGGIDIRRVWRPAWRQASNVGRLGNALAMLLAWSWRAIWLPRVRGEVMVVGTDPILAVFVAIPWRIMRPKAKIVHWCHDLYPQAAVADGLVKRNAISVRFLSFLLRFAYRRCDVIADLGECMKTELRIAQSGKETQATTSGDRSDSRFVTLTPWSLVEPSEVVPGEQSVRQQLFGDAGLALLYSGNLGRAHDFELFLELSRTLRGSDVSFCYAGRGARMETLQKTVGVDDSNVRFAGFAAECDLELRLAAADVHLVSLREEWTGAVVPSKFFGALAAGRPVLFAGSLDAAIAKWIAKYDIGWVLTRDSLASVSRDLKQLAGDKDARIRLNRRCHDVYQRNFSKRVQMGEWLAVLNETPK